MISHIDYVGQTDTTADVSTPHFRFIKTPHVSASTPAHPSTPTLRRPAVAHLHGPHCQLDAGERRMRSSGAYSRDGV